MSRLSQVGQDRSLFFENCPRTGAFCGFKAPVPVMTPVFQQCEENLQLPVEIAPRPGPDCGHRAAARPPCSRSRSGRGANGGT
jgi:hypothetical protein